jgi:tetratricopeptide (TPR) repeat protein
VILGVSTRALPQEEMPEVARSLMEEGDRARDAGRLDDALAKYQRAIEVAPELATAYANAGAILFQQKKTADAYAIFVRGVEHAPADRTLLANAAAAAQQLGKSPEALTFIDRALEKNAKDAALHALRGTILRSLGRDADAVASLKEATRLAPSDARNHFSLGNALYATGRKDDAIEEYRKATNADRDYTRAWYNLGAALFDQARYSEALGAYKIALDPIDRAFAKGESVDPIHARAYANLGAIYIRQQSWQQAADAYGKAVSLDPQSADAHYNLGFVAFSTNRFDAAESEYRKALAIDQSLPLAYLHLGVIAWRRGDAAAAAKMLRDGLPRLQDAANRTVALRILGRAELKLGNVDAAAAAFRENASDSDSAIRLARIERRAGRLDAAATALANAPSDNRAALLERALLARDRGDLARERTALEALLAKDANRAELRSELATNLLRTGDVNGARKYLDPKSPIAQLLVALANRDAAALAQMTNDPVARGDAGLVLWQNGHPRDARPHLAAGLAADPAWLEVAVAAGELSIADREYQRAIDVLSRFTQCPPPPRASAAGQLDVAIGTSENLCTRAKRDLAIALLAIANGDARGARPLLDRAVALDERLSPVATFIRGSIDLTAGALSDARDELTRAVSSGLPAQAEAAARKYLEAMRENAAPEPAAPELPTTSTPRRTALVFLPDTPAESEKRLAETMSAFVTQLGFRPELFRRADDARAFFAANRNAIGVVISNPEFVSELSGGLVPRFAFSREGRSTYRRVVVVPVASPVKSLSDLKGRTLSVAEGLRDTTGAGAKVILAPDDLTALANALFGRSDAALVSESNTLLAQNASKLRVISTAGASPMPVIALAPMPREDRDALTTALRSMSRSSVLAPLQMSGVAELGVERERPAPRKIEVTALPAAALGLVPPSEPPPKLALRAVLPIPQVAIDDAIYDEP